MYVFQVRQTLILLLILTVRQTIMMTITNRFRLYSIYFIECHIVEKNVNSSFIANFGSHPTNCIFATVHQPIGQY